MSHFRHLAGTQLVLETASGLVMRTLSAAFVTIFLVFAAACSKTAPSRMPAPATAKISNAPAAPAQKQVLPVSVPTSSPSSTATQQASSTPAKLLSTEETQGPFQIAGQTFTFVKHMQSIEGSKSADDSTVDWWELRDASGKAVYRQQHPVTVDNGRIEDTESVGARELKTKFGQGILVDGLSLPSAPDTGTWVQVFGLFNGQLVPFGPPMSTTGEFIGEDVDTYEPSRIFAGQQPQTVSRDILKFRVWTGNFDIIYGVLIDWIQAKVRPAWLCSSMTSKGRSSACRYKVQASSTPRSDMTFVRLFPEADEGATAKHVVIKPESKIEFIEALADVSWSTDQNNTSFGVADSDKVWLHVRVDGTDGWISGEEDLEAVGLPQAG